MRSLLHGFSLIEILIACVLASGLALGLGKLLISQYQLYHVQQGLARLQESAQFASLLLSNQIREAGYIGCARLDRLVSWQNTTLQPLSPERWIRLYQPTGQTWQPALPSKLPKTIVPGTAVIEVNRAEDINARLAEAMTASTVLIIDSDKKLAKGDPILIADCEHADVAEIVDVTPQGPHRYQIQVAKALSYHYDKTAFVGIAVHTLFYIADTKRLSPMQTPIYALYTFDKYRQNTELVPGITGMKILPHRNHQPVNIDQATAVDLLLTVESIDPMARIGSDRAHYQVLRKQWPVSINLEERLA